MSKSAKCELWVAVDEDGAWVAGHSFDDAAERYTDEIGNHETRYTVKLNVTVHFPPTREVDVDVPVPGSN